MKIEMTKRVEGFYAQWYEVHGRDTYGRYIIYAIYSYQANTYAKAVKFWKDTWGHKKHFDLVLKNAKPFGNDLAYCC